MTDLPIALRRTRRSTSSLSAAHHGAPADMPTPPLTPSVSTASPSSADSGPSTPSSRQTKTPSRRRIPQSRKRDGTAKSKRVRFSDPGPRLVASDSTDTPASSPSGCSCSTGLTPFIRRTSLETGLPVSGDVTFLPLRQVLGGRVQRRLRRNGLSEEMNKVYAEKAEAKKKRAAEAERELERLRKAVAEKDELIERLEGNAGDDTVFQDNDRVMALQREVGMLRRQLASEQQRQPQAMDSHDRTHNWTMAARDPFASTLSIDYANGNSYVDNGYGFDDDADDDMTEAMADVDHPNTPHIIDVDGADLFGDDTMAELQCSTPSRPRRQQPSADANKDDSQQAMSFAQSFPTPPATSPIVWADDAEVGMPTAPTTPTTPVTPHMHLFSTRRISASPVSSPPQPPPASHMVDMDVQAALPDPETQHLRGLVTDLVRALADKTAALEVLSKALEELSPQEDETDSGAARDASDIVARLAAAFRAARLELEYLTPGEIELPLAAPAAAVLDLLLSRLRALAQQVQAADAQIDEYHALEGSLRQQLGARVQAMDGMAADLVAKDATIAAHEATIADLNVAADRFKGALASYARDVAELEALVGRLEQDAQRATAEAADAKKDMAAAQAHVAKARRAAATHGQALALRDARVHELRGEIGERDAALRAAQRRGHESARQLREDNAALAERLAAETQRAAAAKAAVATLQALLDAPEDHNSSSAVNANKKEQRMSLGRRLFGRRSTSVVSTEASTGASESQGTLSTPPSTEAAPRSTKKRRRYDSGLGFLDEEDAEDM
ncbi:hypothetical protein SPBR_05660 [Sporothrix brasiliensis 5110]|uniref:Uncharacterized protein n=1 Tax=Sporothrix brasiliensis 5110 TaxID=1398154 RepID=A0A0C2J4F2_9PEZI|nr:uncharacterized protein SPBR_05660 [Sporothrix brasiliensis 5110]KIH93900.1 hypothetical protein SPBR_05660 [Sporothrix brasiliensis 5110]